MTRTGLLSDFDAQHWAEDFVTFASENPDLPKDEGTMLAWFAGAIMCGYDQAKKERQDG